MLKLPGGAQAKRFELSCSGQCPQIAEKQNHRRYKITALQNNNLKPSEDQR